MSESEDVGMHFTSVSKTLAAHGELSLGSEEDLTAAVTELATRLTEAVDQDLASLAVEVEASSVGASPKVVSLVKRWARERQRSRKVLLPLLMDATLDPWTWSTAHEDVGPRPAVSVDLFLPGSLAHGRAVEHMPEDIDVTVVYRGLPKVGGEVGELAPVMTPEVSLPTPAVVLQARRNAEARARLLGEFGALTAAQVAEAAGSDAKNTSALAGRWRREGRLMAVEHHGTVFYPAFQFDADGRPKDVIASVLSHLEGPAKSPWQIALWFTSSNGWLGGRRPVDLLDDEPATVVSAAAAAVSEPVG